MKRIAKWRLVIIALALAAMAVLCFYEGSVPAGSVMNKPDTVSTVSGETRDYYTDTHDAFGAWLKAGVDYAAGTAAAPQESRAAALRCIDSAQSYGVNLLMITVQSGTKTVMGRSSLLPYAYEDQGDLFADLIDYAHNKGILVYAVVSVTGTPEKPLSPYSAKDADDLWRLCAEVAEYNVDGLLLDGMEAPPSGNYADYAISGGGEGAQAYGLEQQIAAVARASQAAQSIRGNLYIGVSCAVTTPNQDPSQAGELVMKLVQKDIAQFVVVKTDLEHHKDDDAFAKTAAWFSQKTAEQQVSLYISHLAHNANADQLVSQAICLEKHKMAGSLYDTLSDLMGDKTGSTAALVRYYAGKFDKQTVQKELVIASPTKTVLTTYESSLSVTGSSDPNFPLTVNGTPVDCTDEGFFSLQLTLKTGANSFEFAHKGQTVKLSVTYAMVVLKDVSPISNMTADGGSALAVSTLARKGSTVTATLAGKSISLKPQTQNEQNASEFVTYIGTFTLPAATGQSRSLGKITFSGLHGEFKEKKTGGTVTLNAAASPIDEHPAGDFRFDKSLTLGRWRYVAEIRSQQAETFDGHRLDDRSRSTNAYLPKGTLDYCSDLESIIAQDGKVMKYRLLDYGKRVYSYTQNASGTRDDYLNIYYCQLPTTNALSVAGVSNNGRHTFLTLNTLWKAPFEVTLSPQPYAAPSADPPNYAVTSTTYRYMDIKFRYAVSGQGSIDLSNNPIFSHAEWIKNDGSMTLRLTLRRTGNFYGWGCDYNASGQLVFRFLNPARVTKSAQSPFGYSLANVVVVLDAGHGGANPGAVADYNGKTYHEDTLNFALTLKLKAQLETTGASVVLVRDGDYDLTLEQRTVKTRTARPDLFISIHRNASTSAKMSGFEDYYYQPYSMKLATTISARVGGLFSANHGAKYIPPMYVTRISDCPAVLLECGYMSNAEDFSRIIQSEFDDKIADQVVRGVIDYFLSIQ